MTTRIGISELKTEVIALINNNIATINTGISPAVKQVIYAKPDINELVLPVTMFPTIVVYFRTISCDLRGASKRYETKINCEIHSYVRDMKGVKDATLENITLIENIAYVIQSNVQMTAQNAWIKTTELRADDYIHDQSGFIAHGAVICEITKYVG